MDTPIIYTLKHPRGDAGFPAFAPFLNREHSRLPVEIAPLKEPFGVVTGYGTIALATDSEIIYGVPLTQVTKILGVRGRHGEPLLFISARDEENHPGEPGIVLAFSYHFAQEPEQTISQDKAQLLELLEKAQRGEPLWEEPPADVLFSEEEYFPGEEPGGDDGNILLPTPPATPDATQKSPSKAVLWGVPIILCVAAVLLAGLFVIGKLLPKEASDPTEVFPVYAGATENAQLTASMEAQVLGLMEEAEKKGVTAALVVFVTDDGTKDVTGWYREQLAGYTGLQERSLPGLGGEAKSTLLMTTKPRGGVIITPNPFDYDTTAIILVAAR